MSVQRLRLLKTKAYNFVEQTKTNSQDTLEF